MHDWDDDCCCIHCGIDGADVPKPWKENMPSCPVNDYDTREGNREMYRSNHEIWSDWDETFT